MNLPHDFLLNQTRRRELPGGSAPEGREMVAGGGAKRNHRDNASSHHSAPEGREKRPQRIRLA